MVALFLLTLRQTFGRSRMLIMTILAVIPVFVAFASLSFSRAPPVQQFEAMVLNTMLAGAIIPLIVLATARAAFGTEIEDRTLANLTLTPIPRWRIVVPKLLGVIVVSAAFIAASAGLTGHIAFNADLTATVAVTVAALVAVLLYSAVFVWLDLMTPQAIGFGLAYIVLWEGFFSSFVYGVRFLSIRSYSISLMHGMDERRFASVENVNLGAAVAVSAVVFVLFLLLSIRRLRTMDVP